MTKPEKDEMKKSTRRKRPGADRQFLSFFSGAQGLDLGLEAAGFQCIAANDFDSSACATVRENRPDLKLYECDIRELSAPGLVADLGIEVGQLFAITGGPPCQAFSTAGRRLGLNDERGNVFLHFVELIGDLRPRYAIFENVRGLLSAPLQHRPHDQRGPGFPDLTLEEKPGGALLHILGLLDGLGYKTNFTLYNTANYGVPQVRERLLFIASRDGHRVPLIPATHDQNGGQGLKPWVTFRDATRHLRGPHHFLQFPEGRLKYYELLKQGENWRDLPLPLQQEAIGQSWYSGGGRTGFFRRLAWDKPAPTLVTRPTMKATDLCHPEDLRPLSVEEYAAIQTFPENYRFTGRLDDQYRQIGNAVPCAFGEAIGRHLLAFDSGLLMEGSPAARYSRYSRTDYDSWRSSVSGHQDQLPLL